MQKPLIGLLDCNNFFVSCERLFRPDLARKPVLVLSSNDGCVVSRSKEVKDIGVPMGVPYFQIKDTVKKHRITTFSSHFALYRDISRRVFAVMREELEIVEQYSVDEAFFLIDGNPEVVVKRVKERVEQVVGIPVSIGVAATKTQAKYANQIAKKGAGIYQLTESDWVSKTSTIPLQDIWGIGGQMELKFKQYGLRTVADLLAVDQANIATIFGVVGTRLQCELRGQVAFPVRAGVREAQQSIMSSRSFKTEVTELSVLADAVAYHTRHIAAELRENKQKAAVLRVSIRPSRHGDFVLRGGSKEAVLLFPTNDSIELIREANTLLEALYEPGVPYKKAGVVMSGFVSTDVMQTDLFNNTQVQTAVGEVMKALDGLNTKAGKELVLVGSRLKGESWQSRSLSKSPAYTTDWDSIKSVAAK